METENLRELLTAVVPIGPTQTDFQKLFNWIPEAIKLGIQICLVFDGANSKTFLEQSASLNFDVDKVRILHSESRNPGGTRNVGLANTQTQWVCFWDSDDLPVVKEFYEMFQYASRSGADVAIGNFRTDQSEFKVNEKEWIKLSDIGKFVSWAINPGIWRMAFNRRILNFDFEHIRMGEDQVFLAANQIAGKKILWWTDVVYIYSLEAPGQLTKSYEAIQDLKSSYTRTREALGGATSETEVFAIKIFLVRQLLTQIKRFNKMDKKYPIWRLFREIVESPRLFISIIGRIFFMKKSNKKRVEGVTSFITGGLGNQLFQYSAGRALGNFTDPKILIDTKNPRLDRIGILDLQKLFREDIHTTQFPRESKILNKSIGLVLRLQTSPKDQKKYSLKMKASRKLLQIILRISMKEVFEIISSNNIGFYPLKRSFEKTFSVGYFQSYHYVDGPYIENIFSSYESNSKSKYLSNLIKEMKNATPIVVHIRLGDYKNEDRFGIPDRLYYSTAIDRIKRSNPSLSEIWLFSDEPSAAVSLLGEIPGFDVRVMSDRNLSAVDTLDLMRYGSAYVIGNSTYAWWGAFLRKDKTADVVVPAKWFFRMSDPVDLLPPDWIRLDPHFERSV